MEGFDRVFSGYPEMVCDLMDQLFIVDGAPVKPLKTGLMPIVKRIGMMNLLKDARGAMKAL